MSNPPWTPEENDLIVTDYFAMLAEDMVGRPYDKAQHRRRLMPHLQSRTEGAVEFKLPPAQVGRVRHGPV